MQNHPTTQPAATPLLLQHQLQLHPHPQTLSPCSSSSSSSNSPEFEFWMVHNPTQPQPDLLSADQLFLDGVLLPLHLLHLNHPDPKEAEAQDASSQPRTTSKRWTDIFKRSEKKSRRGGVPEEKSREEQVHRREKRGNSADLNIKLWPFLRSRSEGNGAARPRMSSLGPAARRVSSAPCSRSNSGGDHKSRKWPGSPARQGLHLGRASPVWQVKPSPRGGGGRKARARVLNLNVAVCSGYSHHLGCRTDGIGRVKKGIGATGSSSGGSTAGNMFNLRGLFTKKVH